MVSRAVLLLIAAATGAGASAQTTIQSPSPYMLPNLYAVEADADHRAPGVEPAPSPRRGLVAEGIDYTNGGGLPFASPEIHSAARAACPAGEGAMQVPAGVLAPAGDATVPANAVIVRFILIATEHEALLVRRFPVITGSDGCQLRHSYRIAIDRAFQSGGMATSFALGDGTGAPIIATTTAEAGRSPLLDDLIVSIVDLDEVRLHQPQAGTYPAPRIGANDGPIVCFDMSDARSRGHECFLDVPGPWRGLNVVSHSDRGPNDIHGQRVESLRRDILIDGRLFQWDRAITLVP